MTLFILSGTTGLIFLGGVKQYDERGAGEVSKRIFKKTDILF